MKLEGKKIADRGNHMFFPLVKRSIFFSNTPLKSFFRLLPWKVFFSFSEHGFMFRYKKNTCVDGKLQLSQK